MDLPKHALDQVHRGKAVLFLGAGASTTAGLPSGRELANQLRDRFGITDDSLGLRDLCQYIEETADRPSLVAAVREVLLRTAPNPPESLRRLLTLNWAAIITTNYDDLIEMTLKGLQRSFSLVVADEDVPTLSSNGLPVFKIHGSLERTTSLVLTDEDYLQFGAERTLIGNELRSLFSKFTVFFVGYSFLDSNIREITQYITSLLPRDHHRAYLVAPNPTVPLRSRLARFDITLLLGTLDDLATALSSGASAASSHAWLATYLNGIIGDLQKTENVFTMLRLNRNRLSMQNTSFPTLDLARLVKDRSHGSSDRIERQELLRARGRWMLLGQPGCGKSTLMRMLALWAATEASADSKEQHGAPIILDLGRYKKGCLEDLSLVADSVSLYLEKRPSLQQVEKVLDNASIVWILDSLDEAMIGQQRSRNDAWDEVLSLTRRYPGHTFIVSCRSTHAPSAHDFSSLYIFPFSEEQIYEFVERYLRFFGSPVPADELITTIPEPLRELARNPLILSMIVSTYVSFGNVPTEIDELYKLFVRHILESVEEDKGGSVSAALKDLALSALAFEMLVSGHPILNASQAREIIASRLHQLYDNRELATGLSADIVIDELVYSGLLLISGRAISFLHLSLLEYFASCEMNREYNFVAQSEMDQHFLRNPHKIQRMIDAAEVGPNDTVLELGAGIGSVARHFPDCGRLILLELDRELTRILQYQFPKATILQTDVLKALPSLQFDVVFSDLPFFLTKQVVTLLESKQFRCAVMSVKDDDDLTDFAKEFSVRTIEVLNEEDFFPKQPFKSKVIMLRKMQEQAGRHAAAAGAT